MVAPVPLNVFAEVFVVTRRGHAIDLKFWRRDNDELDNLSLHN